jgi:AraC-like DNA-binding protein
LLAALQAAPEDNRTLVEWARALHTTERTLARRCQKELGMSLGQWRTRLRLVKALDWLRGEMPVQEIAWRLGYASTSAFIAMFQREQGCAPSAIASSWANPWPEPHERAPAGALVDHGMGLEEAEGLMSWLTSRFLVFW